MVNNEDFGKRIQKIMDHYALSASGFADMMGVGRSSISHILSGRNKPSLDFVMKIVDAYSDVELYWLLYGQGTFPVSEKKTEPILNTPAISVPTTPLSKTIEQDLFSSNSSNIYNEEQNEITKKEHTVQLPSSSSSIERVLIFYSDGTFDQYTPKKS